MIHPISVPLHHVLRWQDFLDIGLVTVCIYYILVWSKGTRSHQLIKGIVVVLLFYILSTWLQLYTVNWLMQKITTIFLIALIIVFQPELREVLERLGRTSLLGSFFSAPHESANTAVTKYIIKAILNLSENKTGSIIVLQKATNLSAIIDSGTELNAEISTELLLSIFHGKNPLHDGAVVIAGNKIVAAGCLLPLSESKLLDKRLGTRHRAGLGISERTDSIVLVTSEETGIISVAFHGQLTRYLTRESLEEFLFENYFNTPTVPSIHHVKEFFKNKNHPIEKRI